MADNKDKDNLKASNVILNNLAILMTPENVQKYILGNTKDGNPRAVYDVIRDYTKPKKKKKKNKNNKKSKNSGSRYDLYVTTKKKKKKNKKNKKNKHWHI